MDYDITLEPVYKPLTKIRIEDAKALSDHPWFNRTLCEVNDCYVRIGVFKGEFHWHHHENEDEFFFVLEGSLEIEIQDADTVKLGPFEGYVVPKGVRHRPSARTGATVLMVENKEIAPTGSA